MHYESLFALAAGAFPSVRCVLIRIVSPKLRFGFGCVVPNAVCREEWWRFKVGDEG